MNIIDSVPDFLNGSFRSLSSLRAYFNKYPNLFTSYFAYHCQDTEERHIQSLQKYPAIMADIKRTHQEIIPIIHAVAIEYHVLYKLTFPINVNLIVGGFGSNAFAEREIIPNVTFALERLSPHPHHLKVIIAHEFGHVAQNMLSDAAGMKWDELNWLDPLIWLLQEGAAIHFSRKTVPALNESIYFSFDDTGDDWLLFCKKHQQELKRQFAADYNQLSSNALFHEWFSIRGGFHYGYQRIGYFLADLFFQNQIAKFGEDEAIIAWRHEEFYVKAKEWLTNVV
ncbi:hypothetical protein [Priestia koreensis]|uniref:hypothetical protein n=1 Tax=Priestia koreensis TaxID=284581 RepID=UPI001F5908C9|nr:hypothetical protein [Priestia koreensis]UNL83524.1 hypothetical protein IE339_15295 [Priestia koreensis]